MNDKTKKLPVPKPQSTAMIERRNTKPMLVEYEERDFPAQLSAGKYSLH